MSGRIEAMTAESAANSKRKNAPKEDEDDDSGSDAGSDVVSLFPSTISCYSYCCGV